MTANVPVEPAPHADVASSGRRLVISAFTGHDTSVVRATGELDLATRNQLVSASRVGNHPNTMIDLSGVTFMDCSGYQAIVAARRFIEGEGRGFAITGQTGQPARFLDMIAELEQCPLRPAPNHRPALHHVSGSRPDDSVSVRVATHADEQR